MGGQTGQEGHWAADYPPICVKVGNTLPCKNDGLCRKHQGEEQGGFKAMSSLQDMSPIPRTMLGSWAQLTILGRSKMLGVTAMESSH